MADAYVPFLLLFAALVIGMLLVAAIPGLSAGVLIGIFVERRGYQSIASISFSTIGTLIACMVMARKAPVDAFTVLAIFGALLTMTCIGAWLGRKLRP